MSKIIQGQTFSVRRFWPAPARTSHKNRNVRRTHPHTIFCARTRTFFRKKIFKKNFFFNFLVLKNQFFTKNECVRTCAAHPHPRGMHARTQTHIFEKFSIFTCVRAFARTHTKGLEMTCVLFSSQIAHQNLFVAKHATLTEKYGSRGEEKWECFFRNNFIPQWAAQIEKVRDPRLWISKFRNFHLSRCS